MNLHRLLTTYIKYFDRFFLDTNIKDKIYKNKVVIFSYFKNGF